MSTIGLGPSEIPGLNADDVTQEWVDLVRKMIHDAGMQPARANPNTNGVQIRKLHDNQWGALMLETSRWELASALERDKLLVRLNERWIPPQPKPAA